MVEGIIKGCKSYGDAYEIISRLRLWKYFAIPMLLSLMLFLVIVIVSLSLSDPLGNYIAGFWVWDFGKGMVHILSSFIAGLSILVLGFMIFKHVVMILSAPFIGPISKIIEEDFTGVVLTKNVSSSTKLVARSLKINGRNLLLELCITIPILLLGLLPVIGFVSPVLLFLLQAYYAGFGNMDPTLERHFTYKESVLFVKRNRGLAIGNGIVFMIFLVIPFLGVLLVLPFSVTAATIETIKIIKHQQ